MNVHAFILTQQLIKYGLAACAFFFTLHCGLLIAGMSLEITEPALGLSWYWAVILYLALVALRFCWLSKAFFAYCFACTQCIVAQRTLEPFGDFLPYMRIIMFAAGVFLLGLLVANFKKFNTCLYE